MLEVKLNQIGYGKHKLDPFTAKDKIVYYNKLVTNSQHKIAVVMIICYSFLRQFDLYL